MPYVVSSCSDGAKQSMHSSGSMIRIRPNWWMQSTGQTSTQERSLMSMQGSAMMYVKAFLLYRRQQLLDQLGRPLDQRRLGDHLVEPGLVRAPQAGGVGVVGETQDGDVQPSIGDLFRLHPRDVADDEIGVVDRVRRNQMMPRKERLQLAPEEEIDPRQQDRRHERRVTRLSAGKGGYRAGGRRSS